MNEKIFAALCYTVLMNGHGRGISDTAPSYLSEKMYLLEEGYDAFLALDALNQGIVIGHLMKWKVEVPEKIKKYTNSIYGLNYF